MGRKPQPSSKPVPDFLVKKDRGVNPRGVSYDRDINDQMESLKSVGQFAWESLPGIGTAYTIQDIKDELAKEEPNYYMIGALAGAEVIGLIPGLGDAAAELIKKGAKSAGKLGSKIDRAVDQTTALLGGPKAKDSIKTEIIAGPGAKTYYNRDYDRAKELKEQGYSAAQIEDITGRVETGESTDYLGAIDARYSDLKDIRDDIKLRLSFSDLSPEARQKYEKQLLKIEKGLKLRDSQTPGGIRLPENPFKFEIDDSKIEIKNNDGSQNLKESTKHRPIIVRNIIPTHTELFKEYPDLESVEFYVDPDLGTGAHFNPTVGKNGAIVFGSDRTDLSRSNSKRFRNTFFHELQHAAQYQDYKIANLYQLGGSPTQLGKDLVRGSKLQRIPLEQNPNLVDLRDEILEIFEAEKGTGALDTTSPGFRLPGTSPNPAKVFGDVDVAKKLARKMRELESELFKSYMRSASETEARLAGRRGQEIATVGSNTKPRITSDLARERRVETKDEFWSDNPKSDADKKKADIKIKLGPMTNEEVLRYATGAINFARYAKGMDKELQGFSEFGPTKANYSPYSDIGFTPKKDSTLEDFGYYVDNPAKWGNTDWAKNKQASAEKYAKEGGKSAQKLLSGPQTAFLGIDNKKPLYLDTEFLSTLKGANDEVTDMSNPKYVDLKKSVEEEGFIPDQKGNKIMVGINHKGEAFIMEGNNRVAIAKEFGAPSVKAEVRYYNGAEEVDGPYSPQNILKYASQAPRQFAEGGSVRPKLRPEGFPELSSSPKPRLRPDPERQYGLADVEFRADVDPLLSKDPIARLGFDVSRIRYSLPEGLNNAFYASDYSTEDGLHTEHGVTFEPDTVNYGPDFGSSKETIVHETRHRGLALLREMLEEDPEYFSERYGVEASVLLDKDLVNEELLTELFDNPDATYIAPTTGEEKSLEPTIQYVKPDTLRRIRERGSLSPNIPNADILNKGIVGLRFAAEDMLKEAGEPTGYVDMSTGPKSRPSKKYKPNVWQRLIKKYFAEGGTVDMNQQMSFAFEDGGLRDDGMMRDPVSGNEVPPGSTAKEVRDDIPAQLSEGEYVVPADVVRYYGVKFFEDLRDNAKMGLQDMEARGRIGGEPVPAGGPMDDDLSPEELAAIQEMMGMAEGGVVNMYKQQQDLYSPPNPAIGNSMGMSSGGVANYAPGGLQAANEQDIYTAGQQAQQAGFTGFPLGSTVFPTQAQLAAGQTTPAFNATASQNIITLYSPDGAEVRTLNLAVLSDREEYSRLLSEGWSTQQVKTTIETAVGRDDGNDQSKPKTTPEPLDVSKIKTEDLAKTAKGLSTMSTIATALGATAGLPVAAFINTKTVAQYNDIVDRMNAEGVNDEGLEKKGSIFGGESSLYENLADTNKDGNVNFGDTWLGDLLGFDGEAGIAEGNPGLRDSFAGARRTGGGSDDDGSTPAVTPSGNNNKSPTSTSSAKESTAAAEKSTAGLTETEKQGGSELDTSMGITGLDKGGLMAKGKKKKK